MKHILALLGLMSVPAPSRAAGSGWSTPPFLIYPPVPPNNSTTPSIATDGTGNSLAVWYDIIDFNAGTGALRAARLASGAVNGLGQPAWALISPVATANVLQSFSINDNVVGMDAQGNAIAVWTDGSNNVFAARLAAGQTTWSAPVTINTQLPAEEVANPFIAVAANGNAIVTWTSSPSAYNYRTLANAYDAQNNVWKGQQTLFGGATELDSDINQVAVDALGNGILVVSNPDSGVQAATFNFSANTWTTIGTIATGFSPFVHAAVDAAGNATIVWLDGGSNVVGAATLPFGQTVYVNQVTLAPGTASPFISFPQVGVDQIGNAVAVWPDASGGLASARHSFATGIWTVLPLLTVANGPPLEINLSVDPRDNAVAVWLIDLGSTSFIQAAALGKTGSSWNFLTSLSPNTDSDRNAKVVLTSQGDAVAIWENDINTQTFSTGTIDSAVNTALFALASLPPSPIPAVSKSGLAATATLLAGAAAFALKRRPAPATPQAHPDTDR